MSVQHCAVNNVTGALSQILKYHISFVSDYSDNKNLQDLVHTSRNADESKYSMIDKPNDK